MDQVKKRPNNFKKTGAAANPGGRPKAEFSWSGVLKEIANRTDSKSGKDFKTAVGEVLFREALKGNIQAIRELGNRWEGMPKQSTDITVKSVDSILDRLEGDDDEQVAREITEQALEN